MKQRLWGILLVSACLAPALPGLAQEDPDDDTYLDGDEQVCRTPPLKIVRPNDSWQFVNVERFRREAEERGDDMSSFENLQCRLFYGSARANIYVRAWVDAVPRGEEGLKVEELLAQNVENVKGLYADGRASPLERVRVGKRAGWMAEVVGSPSEGVRHHLVLAMAHRPDDRAVLAVTLEWDDQPKVKGKALRKDLKKLLKKAKF